MINLQLLIEQANDLAPFPASTVRLAQLVTTPGCNPADVADLIAYEPSLTVQLLRAANSAASASATRVVTVQEAVTRMGTSLVLALAVASGARPHLETKLPAYGLDEGALWRHSVAAAVAAETARKFCSVEVPPEAFTAALLHDVGKVVMGRFLSPDILHYISLAQTEDHLSALEAETQILSVHHGELGGLIAQHWQLPEGIVLGITYHHNPEQGMSAICDFTYLANWVAKRVEASLDDRKLDFSFPPEIALRLGTTACQLENLCPVTAARFVQVSQRYSAV